MIVSVIIVAYNEEKYINSILNDIFLQDYPISDIELILIDSMSNDDTKQLFTSFKKRNKKSFYDIKVLENKEKFLPHGCNVGLRNYTGDIFLRLDAHSKIPKDFITKNVNNILSGEKISGGARPNIIENKNKLSELLLSVEQAMFGSGFANYRDGNKKKYVDSIFHGAYKREVFDNVGLYNEKLYRTEDNEMSYRIREAGYKISYDPQIISYQYTRPTFKSMVRQKYLNGFWIGKSMYTCPKAFSMFHFIPLVFVLSLVFSLLIFKLFPILLYFIIFSYGLFLFTNMIVLVGKKKSLIYMLSPIIFTSVHVSYGIGTLLGLLLGVVEK